MKSIDPGQYEHIVFFTGAGMSAESGVPTYRGHGGIWSQYRWEEYACQEAFDADPEKVLKFHELRRAAVLTCTPHAGHMAIAALERKHQRITVVTRVGVYGNDIFLYYTIGHVPKKVLNPCGNNHLVAFQGEVPPIVLVVYT